MPSIEVALVHWPRDREERDRLARAMLPAPPPRARWRAAADVRGPDGGLDPPPGRRAGRGHAAARRCPNGPSDPSTRCRSSTAAACGAGSITVPLGPSEVSFVERLVAAHGHGRGPSGAGRGHLGRRHRPHRAGPRRRRLPAAPADRGARARRGDRSWPRVRPAHAQPDRDGGGASERHPRADPVDPDPSADRGRPRGAPGVAGRAIAPAPPRPRWRDPARQRHRAVLVPLGAAARCAAERHRPLPRLQHVTEPDGVPLRPSHPAEHAATRGPRRRRAPRTAPAPPPPTSPPRAALPADVRCRPPVGAVPSSARKVRP